MFFKKKKRKKSSAQVIEILGKVEVQSLTGETDGQDLTNAKTSYVEKYFSRNRIASSRKGVFISRDIVHRLADYVHIIGQGEASIGAYVEEIILDHLARNKKVIDSLFVIDMPSRK